MREIGIVAFEEFVCVSSIPTPPTRGDEVLDIVFTSMASSVVETEVFPPLIPDSGRPGRPSDHNVVLVRFELPRNRKFRWMRYSYRKYTEGGDVPFGEWITGHDWHEITGDPSQMAEALGPTLDQAMEAFFPLITHRLRSDQDPWINEELEHMIQRRKKIFRIQG